MKAVATNRKARYNYEVLQTLEAGIQLTGSEVKSCRAGHINLAGSYVSLLQNTPVLKQANIAPYAFSQTTAEEADRDRTLLLQKKQIDLLQKAVSQAGVSIVPLRVLAGKYIKVEIAVVRGKKAYDKRQVIKNRALDRAHKTGQEY